ncbi:hypothetical protein GLOTRDRAFT_128348 [Gloeophyllum trabeum ATCC 11539]|uniref:Uncharacterized protein n=1 Tax=Gloeophyllum trabeum (strain ATCC 11539 / FP-39264 / Madison 617) TaxID=670483 RepID=S7QAJ5_GLOTA|nr:uncharacterized protein GLOTRDRAFT_128348 [Gloeophyllum trabeum ATCC 11539]EPQ56403.1 hypothetical protein GLOTRDRAFT_128348 [Gloeophyllum trabeum ATCC 11539]
MADDLGARNPAYCLPYELLLEVWKHARSQGFVSEKGRTWIPTAFTVSQVCKWWRRAAITTPDLWREIRFLSNAQTPKIVEMIKLQLDRSDGRSLDIAGRLWCSGPAASAIFQREKEVAHQLLSLLSRYALQWDSFSIVVEGASALRDCDTMLALIDNLVCCVDAPHLEHLQIECSGYQGQRYGAVSRCRHLRLEEGLWNVSHLHLRSASVDLQETPLARLTTLDIGCLPPDLRFLLSDFGEILTRASSLCSLCFTGPCLQGGSLGYGPIHMPCLRSLTFNECSSDLDDDGFMFELHCLISAPNLVSLVLGGLQYTALRDFLRSTGGGIRPKYPALARLCLRNVETFNLVIPSAQMQLELCAELARRFPTIEHLELENKSCFLLSSLVADTQRNPYLFLFPHLCKLSWLPLRAGDSDSIKKYMTARASAGKPLTSLRLQDSRFVRVSKSDIEWFEKRVQLELSSHIQDPDPYEWPGQVSPPAQALQ